MGQRSLFPRRWGTASTRPPGESDPFAALHREVNRLFDDISRGFDLPAMAGAGAMSPRVDVCETDRDLRVTAELPGVDPGDVDVTLDDDVLTLRGEKRSEQEDKQQNYHLSERFYGSFSRSIRLPFAADPDRVDASFKDGILTISLPKPPPEQQKARRIDVKSGSAAGPTTKAAPDNTPTG
ncbi:MAG TPA: Hsp20/alpha crystallin family protein [Alphaproteobacteria bacterium]|nr:Hsp20/alpha crystallin family protein [Alphaproteobacteria bacterium]